jgi:hypothetical protein
MRRTFFLVSVFLAGCASMDKQECATANWYAIGLEDGAHGRALERLGDHRKACAEYGVAPDPERYLAGRSEGLKSFCTYERGYSEGSNGHGYAGACPGPLARNFLAGYQRGHDLYELNRRLQQTQGDLRRAKETLAKGIPDPRERARQADRIEDLSREAERLEQEIARAAR